MINKKFYWLAPVLLGLFVFMANRHFQALGIPNTWIVPINFLSFLYLIGLLGFAESNKTYRYRKTNRLNAVVIIPIFNEDPKTFRRSLESIEKQTLTPSFIHIIDDGSTSKECQKEYRDWKKSSKLKSRYTYNKVNQGKREVQAIGFRANKKAEIFITIDSDTVLDKNAIKNGLRPFGEPKVMSVAGLLVGLNSNKNLLTRLVDLGFVSSFLNGRAAWSRVNSVTVNCGGLAFYRSEVVNKYLEEYLAQTVMGKKASSGDDRMMTNLALLEGWTVFQSNSVGYTALPENISHLVRQRVRWWRSFFWGGVWLLRRFSTDRLVWWLVVWQFVSFAFYTSVFITLLSTSFKAGSVPWGFILYLMFTLSYVRSIRYLALELPGLKLKDRIITFALAPLSSLLHFFICSVLQYYGLLTVGSTGWGTRKQVEVQT